jgi:hypothetical protein
MDAVQGGRPTVGTADHYAEFVRLCRKRIESLGITYDTVDAMAGFGVGSRYTSKLLCGEKTMSVFSFFVMARALALLPVFEHDEAQLEHLKNRKDQPWVLFRRKGSRYRPRVRTTGRHRVVEIKLYPDLLRKRAMLGVAARMVKLSDKRRSAIARKAALARWRRGAVNGKSSALTD